MLHLEVSHKLKGTDLLLGLELNAFGYVLGLEVFLASWLVEDAGKGLEQQVVGRALFAFKGCFRGTAKPRLVNSIVTLVAWLDAYLDELSYKTLDPIVHTNTTHT